MNRISDKARTWQVAGRRDFFKSALALGAAAWLAPKKAYAANSTPLARPSINVFSKNLQWLGLDEMAATVARLGFDGIELTVRRGGHIEPAKAVEQLPLAVHAARRHGTTISTIITDITDADHPLSEPILKTASELGIRRYRLGYMRYNETEPLKEQLASIARRFRGLVDLNRRYRIHGGYHNHGGRTFGQAVWDTWSVIENLDSDWIGFQYDPDNAYVRWDGWKEGARLAAPRTRMISIKTWAEWSMPAWSRNTEVVNGNHKHLIPTARDYQWYFNLLHQSAFAGTINVGFEYLPGGAGAGKKQLSGITPEQVLEAMRTHLATLKRMLVAAGIVPPVK